MFNPSAAIDQIEVNHRELYKLVCKHSSQGFQGPIDGVLVTHLPYPHPLFNFASGAPNKDGAEPFENVARYFSDREMPWAWLVGPSSRSAAFEERLVSAGFVHDFDTPGMAIDLSKYAASKSPDVVEVRDTRAFDSWNEAMIAGFSMPAEFGGAFQDLLKGTGLTNQIRYFSAMADDRIVAVSMTFATPEAAGIYCVATLPDYRKRGYGEQVMHACMRAAVEDGNHTAILHSSKAGYPLYDRLGFQELCKLNYYKPPEG